MSSATILEFLSSRRKPSPLWVGPAAHELRGDLLNMRWQGPIQPVLAQSELEGPAVPVLAVDDLCGPHRQHLLKLARAARPGRPVILGGSQHKDILLDAINAWHVFRLVPVSAPPEALLEAVRGAQDALSLEQNVQILAERLKEECRQLQSTLDEITTTQRRLLHAERLTTVGRIVGTLMQQAKTHLEKLEQFKQAQAMTPQDPILTEYVDCVVEGIDGFGTLLQDLLALTEQRHIEPELTEEQVDPLVERAVRLFRHDPLGRKRDLVSQCASEAKVTLDRHRVHQVLLNLMRNAAQATQEGDRIIVRTGIDEGSCVIDVEDTGVGMTEEVMNRIFKPFFTTKGQAGMGIGLRMSRATIERQGGTLECQSKPRKGSCFRIRFPLAG